MTQHTQDTHETQEIQKIPEVQTGPKLKKKPNTQANVCKAGPSSGRQIRKTKEKPTAPVPTPSPRRLRPRK